MQSKQCNCRTGVVPQQVIPSYSSTQGLLGQPVRLLRIHEVMSLTGYQKTSVYAKVKDGSFPPPVRLGARSVAWRSNDVAGWVDSRPVATDLQGGHHA